MLASKGNRQYSITEANKKSYQTDGFDILEDDGVTVIEYGAGKTIAYSKYAELEKAHKELMAKYEKLTGGKAVDEDEDDDEFK